jgi:hypothetical protein
MTGHAPLVLLCWANLLFVVEDQPRRPGGEKPTVAVDLVVTSPVLPKSVVLHWAEALRRAGAVSVRESSRMEPATPVVRTEGKERYRLTALVLPDGNLQIADVVVAAGDAPTLRALLKKVEAEGQFAFVARASDWQLPAPLWAELRRELEQRADWQFEETPLQDILSNVDERLKASVRIDPESWPLVQKRRVTVSLTSVSLGTALAQLLGSVGLAFEPKWTAAGELELWIRPLAKLRKPWPVGWPLKDFPSNAVPRLFDRVTIPVQRVSLVQLATSVAQHAQVPVLFDPSVFHAHRSPEEVELDVGAERPRALAVAVKEALDKAGLKFEVRVDEAGQPFLLITAACARFR